MTERTEADPAHDGREGPPLLRLVGQWFFGAGILLLLPRQWVSAAVSAVIGIALLLAHRRSERRASRPDA